MVELKALSPCAGRDPLTIGGVSLSEVQTGPMALLSPLSSGYAMAKALQSSHGLSWPGPGETTRSGDIRCIWFGLRDVMLVGAPPAEELSTHGAVVDQSDAWAVVALTGEGAADVLARLAPIDLRSAAFAEGQTARTQLLHMNGSITKRGPDDFMIMVFRSMVETLYHDLSQAMAAVASRR